MTRNQSSQRQRTRQNPLLIGTFSQTSLRYLTGKLGPENKVVGYADTNQYSNGGFGGGTMNHWFQIDIESPAWIITKKGGPRPNYIQVSAYDLNQAPIPGRMIFEADSINARDIEGERYYPYLGHAMGAQSDLYNTFNRYRLDQGNDLYFELEVGSYLICVSSTRNEPLEYTLGLVIEFPTEEMFILLEDLDGSFLVTETTIDVANTIILGPVFGINYTLPPGYNGFTFQVATITSGVTVTVSSGSAWLVQSVTPEADDKFLLEPGPGYDYDAIHEHSLSEWSDAWKRERDPDAGLPELFVPLINRP